MSKQALANKHTNLKSHVPHDQYHTAVKEHGRLCEVKKYTYKETEVKKKNEFTLKMSAYSQYTSAKGIYKGYVGDLAT